MSESSSPFYYLELKSNEAETSVIFEQVITQVIKTGYRGE